MWGPAETESGTYWMDITWLRSVSSIYSRFSQSDKNTSVQLCNFNEKYSRNPRVSVSVRYKAELGTTYCSTKWLTTQSPGQVTGFYEAGGFLENTKTNKCNFHSYPKGKMVPNVPLCLPRSCWIMLSGHCAANELAAATVNKGFLKIYAQVGRRYILLKLNSIRRWNYSQPQTVTCYLILWDVIRASDVPTANCQSWPTFLHMRSLNRTGNHSRF